MSNTETVDQFLASLDQPRNLTAELAEMMDAMEKQGKEPDDITKMASIAIYAIAKNALTSMLMLDLASISDMEGQTLSLNDGELPDDIDSMLKGGSVLVALGRNEDTQTPHEVAMDLVRALFEPEVKDRYLRQALDNARKGRYFA